MVLVLGAFQVKGAHGDHVRLYVGPLCQQLAAKLRGPKGLEQVFSFKSIAVQGMFHGFYGLIIPIGIDYHLFFPAGTAG